MFHLWLITNPKPEQMDFFYFLRKNGSLIISTHYQPITAIKMRSLQHIHNTKRMSMNKCIPLTNGHCNRQMHPIIQWEMQ